MNSKRILTDKKKIVRIINVADYSSSLLQWAQIAQLVEQRTENPRVTGSIPVLGINPYKYYLAVFVRVFMCNCCLSRQITSFLLK